MRRTITYGVSLRPNFGRMSTPTNPAQPPAPLPSPDPAYNELIDRVTDRLFRRLFVWTLCVAIPALVVGVWWFADFKKDLDTTLKNVATKEQVGSLFDATKDSLGELMKALNQKRPVDEKFIEEKLGTAGAKLAAALPGWNFPNVVPETPYRARDTNRVAYFVDQEESVRSPIEGRVDFIGPDGGQSGTMAIRIRSDSASKQTAEIWVTSTPVFANEKLREITLSGLTLTSVKRGESVSLGQKLGTVQPLNSWKIAELWVEYSLDGEAQVPPSILPIADHGEILFSSMCHECHGSARSVTATSSGVPTLCEVGERKLSDHSSSSPENVLHAAQTGDAHNAVRVIPDDELKLVVAFVLRDSPAWKSTTNGLHVPGHKR